MKITEKKTFEYIRDEDGNLIGIRKYGKTSDGSNAEFIQYKSEFGGNLVVSTTQAFDDPSAGVYGALKRVDRVYYKDEDGKEKPLLVDDGSGNKVEKKVVTTTVQSEKIAENAADLLTPGVTTLLFGEDSSMTEGVLQRSIVNTLLQNAIAAGVGYHELASGAIEGLENSEDNSILNVYRLTFEDFHWDFSGEVIDNAQNILNQWIVAELFSVGRDGDVGERILNTAISQGMEFIQDIALDEFFDLIGDGLGVENLAGKLGQTGALSTITDFEFSDATKVLNLTSFIVNIAAKELIDEIASNHLETVALKGLSAGLISWATGAGEVAAATGAGAGAGAAAATVPASLQAGIVGAGVAIVSIVISGLVQSILDKHPRAFTYIKYNEETSRFELGDNYAKEGGDTDISDGIANGYISVLNSILESSGAQSHTLSEALARRFGYRDEDIYNGDGRVYNNAPEAINAALIDDLEGTVIVDGDQNIARAIRVISENEGVRDLFYQKERLEDLGYLKFSQDENGTISVDIGDIGDDGGDVYIWQDYQAYLNPESKMFRIGKFDGEDIPTGGDHVWYNRFGYGRADGSIYYDQGGNKVKESKHLYKYYFSTPNLGHGHAGERRDEKKAFDEKVLDAIVTVSFGWHMAEYGFDFDSYASDAHKYYIDAHQVEVDPESHDTEYRPTDKYLDFLSVINDENKVLFQDIVESVNEDIKDFSVDEVQVQNLGILSSISVDYRYYLRNMDEIEFDLALAPTSSYAQDWAQLISLAAVFDLDRDVDVVGDEKDNLFYTSGGDDIVYGGEGNDTIETFIGVDTLIGGEGDDVLLAGGHNDLLEGGSGSDTLVGGGGDDSLKGGDGSDSYYIRFLEAGRDTIWEEIKANDSSIDTLYIGDRLFEHLDFKREGNNLVIYDTTTDGSKITILDQFDGSGYSQNGPQIGAIEKIVDSENNVFIIGREGQQGDDTLFGGVGQDTIDGGNGRDYIEGGKNDDVLTGGGAVDTIFGGGGNDSIDGGVGSDVIDGGDGRDTLQGGSLHDSIDGGAGDDVVIGGSGDDTLVGGEGSDLLHGNSGHDSIDGGLLDDTLYGSVGRDTIDGGAGNDSIQSGTDSDTVYGGDGDDTVQADAGDDLVLGEAGDDNLRGYTGSDTIEGGEGDDNINGEDGADSLYGGTGQDSIWGAQGDDRVFGDGGDDRVDAGDGSDTVFGGEGNDHIIGGGGLDTLYGEKGDDNIYGGIGGDYIEGNEGSDVIDGGKGNDTIHGGIGNDVIVGGDGDDTIKGDNSNDHLSGGLGDDLLEGGYHDDTLNGDEGNDRLIGGSGNDSLRGGEGNDTLQGNIGDDILRGNTGDDVLEGAKGDDKLYGGGGDDGLNGGVGSDTIYGGDGSDDISGGDGDDTLYGGNYIDPDADSPVDTDISGDLIHGDDGNDYIIGGKGGDSLHGGDDQDTIKGQSGDDLIYGGKAADSLIGGGGDDTLYGGDGEDVLSAGAGQNELHGGADDDLYKVDFGDASKTVISEAGGGGDKDILIASSIDFDNLAPRREGNDFVLYDTKQLGNRIEIEGQYNGDKFSTLEVLIVSDGVEFWLNIDLTGEDLRNDIVVGTDAADVIHGHSGDDSLYGGLGDDVISGGEGADTIRVAGGENVLHGNAGDDLITGSTMNDRLYGESEDDLIDGKAGDDLLVGGSGNDILRGDLGDDELQGQSGADQLFGGSGNDALYGGGEDDSLDGGDGDDILVGGVGSDTLNGRGGSDSFVWHLGDLGGRDIIYNFTSGEDSIDLTSLNLSYNVGSSSFSASGIGEIRSIDLGPYRLLTIDADGDGVTDQEIELRNGDISDDDILM